MKKFLILFFVIVPLMGCTYHGVMSPNIDFEIPAAKKMSDICVAVAETDSIKDTTLLYRTGLFEFYIEISPAVMNYWHIALQNRFKKVYVLGKNDFVPDDVDVVVYPFLVGGAQTPKDSEKANEIKMAIIVQNAHNSNKLFDAKRWDYISLQAPFSGEVLGFITAVSLFTLAPITIPIARDNLGELIVKQLEEFVQQTTVSLVRSMKCDEFEKTLYLRE